MALEIIWSATAERGFDEIIEYLKEEWTEREVSNFIKESNDFFRLLSENPRILKSSGKRNLRRGPMNRLTVITYKVMPRKKQIYLVNIRSTRQKPI